MIGEDLEGEGPRMEYLTSSLSTEAQRRGREGGV